MKINALYRKYFQKSKIFLYPLLDIKRGTSVVPSHTFVAWNDTYKPEDMKLICLYETRLDKEYINFEKNVLQCFLWKLTSAAASDVRLDWVSHIASKMKLILFFNVNLETKRA